MLGHNNDFDAFAQRLGIPHISCDDCFGLPTDCGICNTIRQAILLPARLSGLAILAAIDVVALARVTTDAAAEVRPMATKRRGKALRWVAIAGGAAGTALPAPAAAGLLGPLMGVVAPSLFSGGAAVPVALVLAGAVAATYGTYKAGEAIVKATKKKQK